MPKMEGNTSLQQTEAPRVMTVDEAAALHEQRQAAKGARPAPATKPHERPAAAPGAPATPAKQQTASVSAKEGLRALARHAQETLAGGVSRKGTKAAKPGHKKPGREKAAPKKGGRTLRAEVHDVLQGVGKGKPMTVAAIAKAITERGRYERPNGKPVSPGHIAFLAIRSPELTYGKGGKKTNVGLDLRALKALQK